MFLRRREGVRGCQMLAKEKVRTFDGHGVWGGGAEEEQASVNNAGSKPGSELFGKITSSPASHAGGLEGKGRHDALSCWDERNFGFDRRFLVPLFFCLWRDH